MKLRNLGYNVRMVARDRLGVAVRHWREMPAAAAALAADADRLAQIRRHLAALPENQAVYEVLDVIARTIAARRGFPAA